MHSPFAIAFTPGSKLEVDGETVEIATRVIGELVLTSGQIVVADPFLTSFENGNLPLSRTAPVGTFPVELSLAQFETDQRVACARVRFSPDAIATRWEVALFEGQTEDDASELPGYGVDAGTGCFFDAATRGAVDETLANEWLAAHHANYVDTWSWHVAPLGGHNVVMCSSGWGDGVYASWWGFDEAGNVVELVTDFDVLAEHL